MICLRLLIKQISFENKWHQNICLYFLKCYFWICSMEIKSIWFLTHSLFLINGKSRVLISMTSVKRLLKDKTKVEFRARFCENYGKVLSFLKKKINVNHLLGIVHFFSNRPTPYLPLKWRFVHLILLKWNYFQHTFRRRFLHIHATIHKSCFYIKMSKTTQKTKWHERYLLINKAWVNNFLKNVI